MKQPAAEKMTKRLFALSPDLIQGLKVLKDKYIGVTAAELVRRGLRSQLIMLGCIAPPPGWQKPTRFRYIDDRMVEVRAPRKAQKGGRKKR